MVLPLFGAGLVSVAEAVMDFGELLKELTVHKLTSSILLLLVVLVLRFLLRRFLDQFYINGRPG